MFIEVQMGKGSPSNAVINQHSGGVGKKGAKKFRLHKQGLKVTLQLVIYASTTLSCTAFLLVCCYRADNVSLTLH